jgi:hypothetical protein
MSKSNATELDLLKFIFNNTAIPWAAAANLYVAAHTADPGEGGDQLSSECSYTGYARVLVTRDSGGFTTSANPVVNAADIVFPLCTGGSETITHLSVGLASSGASQILYSGAVGSPLAVSNNIQPRVLAGQFQVSED